MSEAAPVVAADDAILDTEFMQEMVCLLYTSDAADE